MCYARLDRDFYFLYGVVFVFILAPAGFCAILLCGKFTLLFFSLPLSKMLLLFIIILLNIKGDISPISVSDLNRVRYSGNIVFSLGCCGWKDTDVSLNTT